MTPILLAIESSTERLSVAVLRGEEILRLHEDPGSRRHAAALLPAIGVAALGLLMVSPIPYYSGKDLGLRGTYTNSVIAVVFFTALIAEPQVSLFLVGLVYVSSGPLGIFWRWRTGRP